LADAVGLFTGRGWAPRATVLVGAAFLIWFWADRLLLVRSEYALRTLPFALFVTIIASAGVLIVLRRPIVRRYFGELMP
jgi:hypothetical protein